MVHNSTGKTVHCVVEEFLLVYRLGDARGDARGEDCIGTQCVVEKERLVELSQAPVDLRGVHTRCYGVKEESAGRCVHIGGIESRNRKVGRRSVCRLGDGVGKESVE